MAQLWGGRFTKETDQLVYNFNASITFDKRFYKQDIKGSLAHVAMLAKQGILTEEEKEQITDGLNGILADVESGKLEISDKYEDIHSFVEATLIGRIGDPGKKLHTGRSRNDQVALDMKLFTRDEIHEIDAQVKELLEDTKIDEGRIAAEIVIFADKICTDEEVVRLRSHIEHMKATLRSDDSGIGRKLDFIAQEMNREANTILSKANDLETSNIGIELKTEIEKVREQIQNIE